MKQSLINSLLNYGWWIGGLAILLFLSATAYRSWRYPYRAADAVPGTAAAVFGFPADKARESGRDSVTTAGFFDAFPELEQDYSAFQSFFQRGGAAIPADAEWIVQNLGSGQLALSLIVEAPSFPWEQAIAAYQSEASTFRGESIWRLSSPDGATLAFARCRNLLLLGRLPLQVEACITQLKEGLSGWALPAAGSPRHLYLRVDNLLGLGSGIWGGPVRDALTRFEPYCEGLNLSFEQKGDTLDFTGKIEGGRLPVAGKPEEVSDGALLNYLPDNLAWCFRKPLGGFPEGKEEQPFYRYLAPWVGDELAFASMALPGDEADNQFLLLAIQPGVEAQPLLNSLAQEVGALGSYDFQSFRIIQLRADTLLQPLGAEMKNPYFTILGDYVAFSTSKAVLEQLARSVLAGKAMVQDEAFLRLWAGLQPRAHTVWGFANAALLRFRLPAYLDRQQEALTALLSPFRAIMLAVEPDGGVRGRALPLGGKTETAFPDIAWSATLDTSIASTVQPFAMGRKGTGFLVQDHAHALYLLSAKGERIWKRQLQGRILGAISFLAGSRDGQWRLAFATPDKIHVWDQDGGPKVNFPLLLPAPASSPLLAADFEGQGRHHFFIACENGKIYGYNQLGLPIDGWSPQEKTDSLVRQPMVHFQKNNMDFILALSEAGTLYAFRRDGEYRFEPVETGASFLSPPFFQAEGDMERIALGDERGLGHIINFQGDYFRLKLMPKLAPGTRFLFTSFVGDGRRDYLAYRGQDIVARYYDGLKFITHFSEKLELPADTAFILPHAGSTQIGLLHRQDRKISVLDSTGAVLPGFPLAGDTPFGLAPQKEGGQLIVTGYGASIYAYRFF